MDDKPVKKAKKAKPALIKVLVLRKLFLEVDGAPKQINVGETVSISKAQAKIFQDANVVKIAL